MLSSCEKCRKLNPRPLWELHVKWIFKPGNGPDNETDNAKWLFCDKCANKVMDFLDQMELGIERD